MSAESPQRGHIRSNGSGPSTVTPQQVTDPTILDSVAGFINDVVPVAYNLPNEVDDKIQWAHFEKLESENDLVLGLNFDGDNAVPLPLILILGYASGIQIWAIPASGEATEILSWRHSTLRTLKLLPTPFKIGSAGENHDLFAMSRPLIALCDSTCNFCTLTFRSLRTRVLDPVKQIQFKNSIQNVMANRHSVVVAFSEKIAVFDAFTLESRLSVTTCYPSPGIQPNPIALGARWLAYAEKKLVAGNRSAGGNEGEGVQSYTATVLHAAKSLGRGLRELTETVAGSLTGNPNFKPTGGSPQAGGVCDQPQKGIVTILDIENKNINSKENQIPLDGTIAHFVAASEAIVCLEFDPSGMLLVTADKRGHDFHVFRIQPHPGGAGLAAVHHLYVLHRGDTSAKVQDMCFSPDSRWITVSTLRGTTHVFPVTPYGGNISVRTHASSHVVNKMSRYQRSAGLTSEGRSSSPVTLNDAPVHLPIPYRNARFAPFPQPTVIQPLAQIRQPVYIQNPTINPPRNHPAARQRLSSASDENITLKLVTAFAPARAWINEPPQSTKPGRESTMKANPKPVESLFVMSCYGTLVQYDLEPQPVPGVAKERVSNDTSIELKVAAKAQWLLHRNSGTVDIGLPMSDENLAFISQNLNCFKAMKPDHNDDHWLSQVEIVTHLGPHRRLWMGPQFTFKTYTITNGSVVETKPVDVRRSKPVNMPISKANAILIESGSANSCEQLFLDTYHKAGEEDGSVGESRLKEDLAEAMQESPAIREQGSGHCVIVSMKPQISGGSGASPLAPPSSTTSTTTKVVNPLGTVVTIQSDDDLQHEPEIIEEIVHENCDEALFRPIVTPKAIFYSESNKNKLHHPDNILTKSLAANTEVVAVRIFNKNDTNNKMKENVVNKVVKARDLSPKVRKNKKMGTNFNKIELETNKVTRARREEKKIDVPQSAVDGPISDELPDIDFDEPLPKPPDSPLFESILKFEDAEDCGHKEPIIMEPPQSEIIVASSEEVLTKKTRKPKAKLGIKISNKDKESSASLMDGEVTAPPPPVKKSWNIVAASKPIKKDDAFNVVEEKGNLIDIDCFEDDTINEMFEDLNLLKIDKLSDDEKLDTTGTETTTESDDSSKVPPLVTVDDDGPLITFHTSSKSSSKRKPKKKRGEQSSNDLANNRDVEDFSSASSFSSASRASPTPSFSDNLLHFPGDSSSSM